MIKGLLRMLFVVVLHGCSLVQAGPTTVTVQPLATQLFYPQHQAPATVLSLHDSLLSFEVSGVVQEIHVQVGDWVKKGDLLASVNPWHYKNQRQQAQALLEELQARLKLAQRQHQRTTKLRKSGQATAEKLEQRQTELQTLFARIKQQQTARKMAQDQLTRTELFAPFAGVVVARIGQIGTWAAPGVSILRLMDHQRLELAAQIRPNQQGQFNQTWQGIFQAEKRTYPVELRTLIPLQNVRTRLQEARFVFVDQPSPLVGTAGRLLWNDSRPHIPAKLLVRRTGQLGIFFATDQKARFHPLAHAIEGLPTPLITLPLTRAPFHGDVILLGRENLLDGHAIQIRPSIPAS